MRFLDKLLRKRQEHAAEQFVHQVRVGAIYEQVLKKYNLPKAEEYFVVVGVVEFLTKSPREAMDSLFRRINSFHSETGIPVGGLGDGQFEHPFKELLGEYQKAMASSQQIDREGVLAFLSSREQRLASEARPGK